MSLNILGLILSKKYLNIKMSRIIKKIKKLSYIPEWLIFCPTEQGGFHLPMHVTFKGTVLASLKTFLGPISLFREWSRRTWIDIFLHMHTILGRTTPIGTMCLGLAWNPEDLCAQEHCKRFLALRLVKNTGFIRRNKRDNFRMDRKGIRFQYDIRW